jgi:hypothetical protein
MKLSDKVKDKIVANLKQELATAMMYDDSALELRVESYSEVTCYISFVNKVGTEFTYHNVYFDEKTGEILQSQIDLKL